jgi:hypothetical protein
VNNHEREKRLMLGRLFKRQKETPVNHDEKPQTAEEPGKDVSENEDSTDCTAQNGRRRDRYLEIWDMINQIR